jgi:hypothetical protein
MAAVCLIVAFIYFSQNMFEWGFILVGIGIVNLILAAKD